MKVGRGCGPQTCCTKGRKSSAPTDLSNLVPLLEVVAGIAQHRKDLGQDLVREDGDRRVRVPSVRSQFSLKVASRSIIPRACAASKVGYRVEFTVIGSCWPMKRRIIPATWRRIKVLVL